MAGWLVSNSLVLALKDHAALLRGEVCGLPGAGRDDMVLERRAAGLEDVERAEARRDRRRWVDLDRAEPGLGQREAPQRDILKT